MKYFCMPADFRKETIARYAALNAAYPDSKVVETYGNITVENCFGSGRDIGKLPKVDLPALKEYLVCSAAHGIGFSYTINPSFMGNREFTPEGASAVREFLERLHEAGVRSLVLAMPSLIELVRELKLDFRIKASTICQITSVNKAMFYKAMGVDTIVLDESLNRDLHTMRRIREAFGENVEIIVNSVCHQDCHLRAFHYNQISGDSVSQAGPVSSRYYPARCHMRLCEDVAAFLKVSWIRPEDLHYYADLGIRYFKVQGRQTAPHGDPVRAAECYFKGAYDGDFKDLLFLFAPADFFKISVDNRHLDGFLKPFAGKEGFCRRDCTTCSYCEGFARQLEEYDRLRQTVQAVRGHLAANDPFRQMLSSLKT